MTEASRFDADWKGENVSDVLSSKRPGPCEVHGNNLAAALAYAAVGWRVFPCRPGRKDPATVHGFHDASTNRT